MLEPDTVRGTPLDMDQYTRLFGTARIPTEVGPRSPSPHARPLTSFLSLQRGCRMETHPEARHLVILRRGQFCACASVFDASPDSPIADRVPDWFDVLDQENRPVLTEREILRNLQAIVADADQLPIHEVCPITRTSRCCLCILIWYFALCRSRGIQSACFQPRIGKCGLRSARPSCGIVTTNRVWKWSTTHSSSSASTMPTQTTSHSFATTSSAEPTSSRMVSRLVLA